MSDIVKAIEQWYIAILTARHFPEKYSFWNALFSSHARKSYFGEKNFLKEKRQQILAVSYALGSATVFARIPNASKSEKEKVVASIKRAMEMDPDFFTQYRDDSTVKTALAFLEKEI